MRLWKVLAEIAALISTWWRVGKLWIQLHFHRWAEREQHPLHQDRPELIVTISRIEWELRELGFEFLI